jgi:hypothetical protein
MLLIAFILCTVDTVSTQLGSLSVNVQIVSILLAKKKMIQKYSAFVLDFPKSAVRGSWKRQTFVTRKRAKFTGAFLLR